jgi:hypothetical protein
MISSQDQVHPKNRRFISALSEVAPTVPTDPFNIEVDANLDRIGAWLNVPNRGYSNETYRLILKATILKNNYDGSMMQLEELLAVFLPGAQFRIVNNLNMSFDVIISGQMTDEQREAIEVHDLIPRPCGVKMNRIVETDLTVFYNTGRTYNSGAEYA